MIKKMIFGISISLFLIIFLQNNCIAQKSQNHTLDFGAGFGLDYGGLLGVKAAYILPLPYFSVFGAAGFQLGGIGWNAGATIHILPQNDQYVFRPNIKVMYGINRSTFIVGASEYNDLYKGWTPGVGFEFMFGKNKAHGFDVDLNFPIGSSDFKNQVDLIENDPRIEIFFVSPIAFSIGYHHEI